MLAPTLDLVRAAQDAGYAVPAFNVFDDLSLRAVLAGAADVASPVIVQLSVKTVRHHGLTHVTDLVRAAAADVPVPVALHLDHCPHIDLVREVLAAGWSSALFDASDRPLVQAERETAELARAAHDAGAALESEVENIVGVEDGVGSDEAVHAYTVEQLAAVAASTCADLLAPALGTSHGRYTSRPVLLPDRAREVREATGRPVVLHGGTGLTDQEFGAFVAAGVSKINVSTSVKLAYLETAAAFLDRARAGGSWEPLGMFDDITAAVRGNVARHCRVFGSAGRVPGGGGVGASGAGAAGAGES